MAKNDVMDWSTTAGSNTDAGSNSLAENQLPGSLNDAIREIMAQAVRELATQGSDITAAATSNIAATGTSAYVKITGTTTITAFGTPAGKPRRLIQWGAATPVTHHATNLILLGGASRTHAAGDVGLFVHEGSGHWRELMYSPAAGYLTTVANDFITYARMQNVSAASRLLGRGSASGAGDPEEIALGTGLSMSGTTVSVTTGTVIQEVVVSSVTTDSTTTAIPNDNSKPQNDEGKQFFSQAFTPKSASSTIVVRGLMHLGHASSAIDLACALFVDSGADAVAVGANSSAGAHTVPCAFTYSVASGSTSSRTYKVRYGGTSGTVLNNTQSGGGIYGGVLTSSLTITEIAP